MYMKLLPHALIKLSMSELNPLVIVVEHKKFCKMIISYYLLDQGGQ